MATTTIPWGDGSGDNIYLTYTSASGNQTVQVSSDPNDGPAREKDITFVSTVGNIARVLTVIQETNMDYVSITWNDTCITFNDTGIAYPYEEEYIVFVDSEVESICVSNWGDGTGIKPSQAAQVTNSQFGTTFRNNTDITSFDELKNFTGLTLIPANAFNGCSSLSDITLPNSVGQLQIGCFAGVAENMTLNLGDGSPSFVQGNAADVSKISTVIAKDLTQYIELYRNLSAHAFGFMFGRTVGGYKLYDQNGNEITNCDIPATYTEIHGDTFAYNKSIRSVTFPSSLTTLGMYSFAYCIGIEYLTIPSTITSIGGYSFISCSGIIDFTVEQSSIVLDNILSTNAAGAPGNGTGTLHIKGSATQSSACFMSFKKVVFDGNFNNNAKQFTSANNVTEQIRIGGGYSTSGTAFTTTLLIKSPALAFAEIMGTITTGANVPIFGANNANWLADGMIVHLGYSGVVCTPVVAAANFSRIAKIYVGDGSSASHDNAILTQYLADTDWLVYSSKLDTWYNYINDSNANPDYIN